MTTAPEHGQQNAENCFREALQRVMTLVRAHPKADQQLFQKMFMHALTADDTTEVQEAVETMVEILRDHGAESEVVIGAFPMPHATEERAPQTRKLAAWTDFVAGRVKRLREERSLTQEALATKAGLSQSHVCRIEKGVHSASRKTLTKIADALGVCLGDIDPVD